MEASLSFPAPRRVTLPPRDLPTGVRAPEIALSLHEAGEGPAVVLCHGFPELAWSWRHQIPALADAGFHVLAPDQRGYGASDAPETAEAHDIHHLTSDLVGLLDEAGIEKAVFVGHDWGGFVVWAMPSLHPESTAGVVGVNTPYTPRSPLAPTAMMRALVEGDDERFYILWFQEPGVAEAVLDPRARAVFEKMLVGGIDPAQAAARVVDGKLDMNPFRRIDELDVLGTEIMPREEREVFIETFERTGFGGGIHWYRNFDRNWETAPSIGVTKVEVPCLQFLAEWDGALRPEMAAGMPALCSDLEMHTLAKCGHWSQQEQPEEVNRVLIDWLQRKFGAG
jgi:pimeloyl-ACP methyl ester carboxylesterase